jgi:putative flippase GtrA
MPDIYNGGFLTTHIDPEPIPTSSRRDEAKASEIDLRCIAEPERAGLSALDDLTVTGPLPVLRHPALAPDRPPAGQAYVTQEPRSAAAKTPGNRLTRLIAGHWRRFIVFSLIGAGGLAVSVALQGILQRAGLPSWTAFGTQAIVLIQVMFAANRLITWRNRRVRLSAALARWNAQRIVVAAMSLAAYWLLARVGASWGAANAAVTVAFTPVQYGIGHAWSFASYRPRHLRTTDPATSVGPPASRLTAAVDRSACHLAPAEARSVPCTRMKTNGTAGPHSGLGSGQRLHSRSPWVSLAPLGLYGVLAVQAVLSLRLVWSNTAFLDEATYLYVGHVELAHWLTGSSVPVYPTYLSGAPVIYPPLAALTDDIGGLAAARILSLCFMLGATSLLWGTTARLADRRSAFFAAAIFAALGPTQYLGAFATYDAMALFLMAAAAWCAVAARDHADSTWLVLAGAGLLALANATKYASGLFDPVIIVLAGLSVARRRGVKPAWLRGGYLAVSSIGLIGVLLAIGGPLYVTGILSTTLARANGGASPVLVLTDAAKWIGLVCLLGALAVAVAWFCRQDRFQIAIFMVLAMAGLLAPLNQARILTTTSLSKHVDFGAWFAAAAAGYAIARLSAIGRRKLVHSTTAAVAVVTIALPAGLIGKEQAGNFFQIWPNSSTVTRTLASLTRSHPGNYLAEDYDVTAYYLHNSIPWQRWYNTWYFRYALPRTAHSLVGLPAYRAAIRNHYFSLIILDFGDTAGVDSSITQDMRSYGGYHVVAEARYWDKFGKGQFTIWAYEPSVRSRR